MRGLICDDHPLMREALGGAMRDRWPEVALDEAGDYPSAWALAETARRMGGDGVIHIEFLDENPPTLAERIQDASTTLQNAGTGEGVEARQRTVVVTGEVIQFLDVPARSPAP